ncbi:MAG: tripartite tricarboxylate transporter TctB family protein [Lachnospiraceae bacterium]
MKKVRWKWWLILVLIVAAGIYYYVALPAISIHSKGFWIVIILFVAALVMFFTLRTSRTESEIKANRVFKVGAWLVGILLLVFVVGLIISTPLFSASGYNKLLQVESGDFATDIEQVDYTQIPLLDKDSAEILGNRKMGSLVDMVSQFEVSTLYSQINYQGKPMRVSPLTYASPIKWLTNQGEGIPAYIAIDMATQDTQLVQLEQGIKYSQAEYFNRNIYRHLRFRYPTYQFDQLSFELDDEGTPYWVCPVKEFTIGLFGGQTIGKVVLCNALTGETTSIPIEECPSWVDRAYPADLLVDLYNYHGAYVNGFWNSILGQKGCLKTTEGYNYIALEDGVWVYTGVTSVISDNSNVGFMLMNQRTRESRYYEIAGASEESAMASAEGQVQHLGYTAAFPLLLNIGDEPTYFMALKDNAGLVKQYAMINIEKYQNVAIGSTVSECEEAYIELLNAQGQGNSVSQESQSITGTIQRLTQAVLDGNTHFYVTLEESDLIFDIPVIDSIEIVAYGVGDTIRLVYREGDPISVVTAIEDD